MIETYHVDELAPVLPDDPVYVGPEYWREDYSEAIPVGHLYGTIVTGFPYAKRIESMLPWSHHAAGSNTPSIRAKGGKR